MMIFRISILLLLMTMPCLAEDVATVKSLQGTAFADTTLLTRGAKIASGKIIRTEEGAVMTLLLPGNHEVILGPAATRVQFLSGRLKTVSLTLYQGQTRHSVSKIGEHATYRVTTPTNVVGVRGTKFSVEAAENGASRTEVTTGEVAVGDDEPERILGANDVAENCFLDRESADGNWFSANRVRDTEEAQTIEAAAAEQMDQVEKMTADDIAEMAVLSRNVFLFAARSPSEIGDAAEGVELLTQSLRIYQRMEARREGMAAKRELTRQLARNYGVSDEASDSHFRQFEKTRSASAASTESFIGGLERLSTLLSAAAALSRIPSGLPIRVPFFGR